MTETTEQRRTPAQHSTQVEVLCIHDLPTRTCGLCTRHPDTRDHEFALEMGTNETGWGYYDELHR